MGAILAALAFAAVPAHPARSARAVTLLDIEEVQVGGGSLVHLRADGVLESQASTLPDPERLVIDLPGVINGMGWGSVPLDSLHTRRVRLGQHDDHLRVVFDAAGPAPGFRERRLIHTPAGLVLALGSGPELDEAVQLVRSSGWDAARTAAGPREGAPVPGGRLRGIDAVEVGAGTLIYLDAPGVRFETFALGDPERFVVDLLGAASDLTSGPIEIGSPHVSRVRVGAHADRVRVVLDGGWARDPFADRRVLDTPGGLLIALGEGERLEEAVGAARARGWPAALRLAAEIPETAPVPLARPPAPGAAPDATGDEAARGASAPQRDETVGQDQEMNRPSRAERELLAEQSGVLLPAGQLVLEPGFSYTNVSRGRLQIDGIDLVPAIVIGRIESTDIDRDIYTAFLAARYGIHNRLEVQVDVPYVYREDSEIQGASGSEKRTIVNGHGIGDITASLYGHAIRQSGWIPDVILRTRMRVPTGKDPFGIDLDARGNPRQLALGSGFWGASGGFSLVKSIDPVVLFGSGEYTWNFERDLSKIGLVDPGNSVEYNLGLALGVNERTALGFSFQHRIAPETEVGGRRILRTDVNSATLFTSGSFVLSRDLSATLSVGYGLTDESPDFSIEVRFPYRVPFRGPGFR